MAAKDNILFSDIFDIKNVDAEGRRFDKVSRINARSENYEMELTLDINNELYPLEIGEKFSLVLATSLSLTTAVGNDTTATQESWRERVGGERTLADDYEYVMYGKVYKYDEGQGSKVSVYISFGGLLMCLEGDFRHLQNINLSENLYLLMRK
ncbi:DNA-directed RNA polymerases I, II, and III subunit RPABC3 [Lunasporangiospora selenospora]|uniref:DNA-directed RNA polymerases I, II, and III subunit RPABC3 n=1 Tax=Lunasporangiospora selenospora TaxID=979761 RepID=A0A9P6KHQ5_9FUNG|nr:DNA-directed RNA polymerases I, II, and III subunit RPABC3 [Lunasporangiospora selenospora]